MQAPIGFPGPERRRPLPFGTLLNTAIRLLAEHVTPIAVLAAVVVFPISIWEGALPTPSLPQTAAGVTSLTPAQITALMKAFAPWVWPLAVDVVASFLMTAAAAYLIAEAAEGRLVSPWAAYAAMVRRLPALVTSGLVEVVGVGIAALIVVFALTLVSPVLAVLAVVVLAVAAAVYLGLTVQVVMREGVGDVRAPLRSLVLMRGAFWPTLGALVVAGLAVGILSSLSTIPLSAGVTYLTRALAECISDLVTITVGMLPVTILTVLYEHQTGRSIGRF